MKTFILIMLCLGLVSTLSTFKKMINIDKSMTDLFASIISTLILGTAWAVAILFQLQNMF